VVEASDGSAGIDVIRANTGFVLLDFTLPGLSSREVFEEVRRMPMVAEASHVRVVE